MTRGLHLLDTDTASFIIKKRPSSIETRLAALPPDDVCVSAVTHAELMYGLRRLDPSHALQALVRRFLGIVRVAAWGAEAADRYADIRHRLTVTGQPIGDMDMMIAGHALALSAVLVTNNTRHFARVGDSLVLANWVEG